MIRAVIVMNTQGKPRLIKLYEFQTPEKQQQLIRRCLSVLCGRPEDVSNFVQAHAIFGPIKSHMKHLNSNVLISFSASLYLINEMKAHPLHLSAGYSTGIQASCNTIFRFRFDNSENELAMLDLIQVFVETLDRCFKNVCELDVVFNFSKMHTILDEMILGGQVLETSSEEVMKAVEEIARLEKSSNSSSFMPKSMSGRFGR